MELGFVAFVTNSVLLIALVIAAVRILAGIQTNLGTANRMERKLDLLLQHAGVKYDPFADVPPEIVEALQQRQKIKAIQLYCLKKGAGLKEAKEFIEELQRRTGLT